MSTQVARFRVVERFRSATLEAMDDRVDVAEFAYCTILMIFETESPTNFDEISVHPDYNYKYDNSI